jgi:hypothetical protein
VSTFLSAPIRENILQNFVSFCVRTILKWLNECCDVRYESKIRDITEMLYCIVKNRSEDLG